MKNRFASLDLIRAVAVFFVISVHFFLNTGFYDTHINSFEWWPLIFIREIFFTCVPLFILLSGYLCINKKFDSNYLYKIFKLIFSYLIVGIICLLFRKFYLNENINIINSIIYIFNFTACPNAWYLEMYIGLFLLIPFLNIIYNNIQEKKYKDILIIVLLLLTSLEALTTALKIQDINLNIFPDYWTIIYPITYYFIGAYIKEFNISIPKRRLFRMLIITLIIQTTGVFIYSYNKLFSWTFFGGYNNIFTVVISSIIFILLKNTNIKNEEFNNFIKSISLVSFEMYLVSYIFDSIMYKSINFQISLLNNIIAYLVCVPIILIFSYYSAYIVDYISKKIHKYIKKYYDNIIVKIQLLKNK